MLRTEAGRKPYDRGLSDLIGELSTRRETFRNRWAAHNVRLHRVGAKPFHHPVVGVPPPRLRGHGPLSRYRSDPHRLPPNATAHPRTDRPFSPAGPPPWIGASSTSRPNREIDEIPSDAEQTNRKA